MRVGGRYSLVHWLQIVSLSCLGGRGRHGGRPCYAANRAWLSFGARCDVAVAVPVQLSALIPKQDTEFG